MAHSNKSKSRDTTEDVGVEDHSVSMNLFHVLSRWTSWSDRNTCNTDDTANSKKKVKAEYSRKADPNGRRSFTDWYKSSVSFLYAPTELPTNVPPEEVRYRAVGVEYEQNGVLKSVYLKSSLLHIETAAFGKRGVRSIILAAGAIMTPKLLMNSGIGPEDVLKEAGVDMLVASELVGRNLHDHPAVGLTFMRLEGEGEI